MADKQTGLPMQTREAPLTSFSDESRTAEIVWTTGAKVRRYDWWNERAYLEELSLDPKHVRMDRLASGSAPLLDTHGSWSLRDVLGVVEGASLQAKEGRATVRFSKRAEVDPIVQDVRDGIIRNISVGYAVHRYERIAPKVDGEPWTYRAVDWEPMELSLVPIGADPNAGVRSQSGPDANVRTFRCEFIDAAPAAVSERKNDMTESVNSPAAGNTTPQPDEAAIRAAARKDGQIAERERQAEIRAAVRAAKLGDEFADELISKDVTADAARAAVLTKLAEASERSEPKPSTRVHTLVDETDVRRGAMADALLHRAAPGKHKLTDAAREFRGMSLIDMARDSVEATGGRVRGLSKREVALIAMNLDDDLRGRSGSHTTSDFPLILASTVNRSLRAAYLLAPRTFVPFCRQATAPDFREVARTQLSELTKFQKVVEGEEYKYLSFGDSQEKYSLSKYGGIIAVTWETLVNDDLNAFDRVPVAMAEEAAATESDLVYGILTGNPNMSDTVALFHSTHGNLAGSGAAITDLTLGAGRAAMRKQTGPQGRLLNLTPDFLVVGPDKEVEANKYTSSAFVASSAANINPNFNTSLQVVVDARITGNLWFLAAAPARVDTIEYAYLEGEDGLYTEQRMGFQVDGLEVKARHVFAAKAIDWRGLYRNPGA